MFWETNIIDILGLVSIIAGFVAIYFWLRIYNEFNKGSLAWLLLTVTSIFMVATPLYFYIFQRDYFRLEFIVLALMFWGAVYVSFFAGAGYTLYRAFTHVPRGSVGKYLIEGFRFKGTVPMGNTHKDTHPLHEFFDKDEGISQLKMDQNKDDSYQIFNEDEGDKQKDSSHPKVFTNFLGNTALVQYISSERYEDMVIEAALGVVAEGRNAVLFTSHPRVKVYKNALESQMDRDVIKLVNLVEDKGTTTQNEAIITLQIDQSNYILDIVKEFPKGCMLLIEFPFISSKSDVKPGIEFLTKIIEKAVANEIGVVMFLDIEGLNESEMNRIMDLFMTQALITRDKITLLKGKNMGVEIPVLNYVDYEKYVLR